jgi:Raf kinase inhibitor-like YbhB/YbcL family protein
MFTLNIMMPRYAKNIRKSYALALMIALALILPGLVIIRITSRRNNMDQNSANSSVHLISPVFDNNKTIPEQYTCRGQNINPPLNILNVPQAAKSLALIMHDPDASGTDFVHWVIWGIPPGTQTIGTNNLPVGAVQGKNSFGGNNYGGPCPPSGTGTHRYIFELYALDTTISLSPDSSREQLEKTMSNNIISQGTLTGLVAASD